jgi:hypothetical protein
MTLLMLCRALNAIDKAVGLVAVGAERSVSYHRIKSIR